MKEIIKKLLREGLLSEDTTLPTTLYHGTTNTLDINDMERNNVRRNDIGVIMKETASEITGTGLYVTKWTWENRDNVTDKKVYNDIYKYGTIKENNSSGESAQKYAGGNLPAFIYEIKVSNDFNWDVYDTRITGKQVNGYNINKEERNQLLQKGVDGLNHGDMEGVILNAEKVISSRLAFKAENYLLYVTTLNPETVVPTNWSLWNLITGNTYSGIEKAFSKFPDIIFIKPENKDTYIKQNLGANSICLGSGVCFNFSKDTHSKLNKIEQALLNSDKEYEGLKFNEAVTKWNKLNNDNLPLFNQIKAFRFTKSVMRNWNKV
jgi:hypothetical protein